VSNCICDGEECSPCCPAPQCRDEMMDQFRLKVARLEEEQKLRDKQLDRLHQRILEAAAIINVKHGDWMGVFQSAAKEKEEIRKAFDIIWQLTNLPFSDEDRKKIQGIALAYAGDGPKPGSDVWHWIGKS